ncbi:DUF4443 domain-containing protein [Nitrosopumilus sp.]|uniref:DUF4443 domain-containing protein n=1 Tax=Nitrosopumilus sp. TaxID=2024843 RepID=UPI002602D025|nr:DUF4443 domain-containing protein [Nitrosopumilus sp.]
MQKVITKKGNSKSLTFSTPHVLKSILLLSSQQYVSRASFCQELKIGEGAVRTLISHLKEAGLVESIKAGTFLTKKGKRFAEYFREIMPSQTFLKKCCLTNGKHNSAILLKSAFIDDIGNGMQQRDYAIIYGASDSLTLIYRKGEFVFCGDKVVCFPDEPEIRDDLIQALEPEEEDIVIITSSDDKFVADISSINTALLTIGAHEKH